MNRLELRLIEIQEELDSFDWKSINELCSYDDQEDYLNIWYELTLQRDNIMYQLGVKNG